MSIFHFFKILFIEKTDFYNFYELSIILPKYYILLQNPGNYVFLLLWLVLPESKIKGAEDCCSLNTIHEEAFLAAFPVSNGENQVTNT